MTIIEQVKNRYLNQIAVKQITEEYKNVFDLLDEDPELDYCIDKNGLDIWNDNIEAMSITINAKYSKGDTLEEAQFCLVDETGKYISKDSLEEYIIDKLTNTL